ncbi:hypothetical protein ABZT16_11320 [Streptomyces flaveolus]|uniref:hypothetical protein n=1 Tax=Streptomyces flaveolus TaxID=67297 RepID=UPI0033A71237
MRILDRARTTGRHRGKSVADLKAELNAADRIIIRQIAELDQLRAERDQLETQLDKAGIELSGAREDHRIALDHVAQLEQTVELRDTEIARLTERKKVAALAESAATETQPIPVLTLQQAFGLRPVTDPGHI